MIIVKNFSDQLSM